MKICGVYAGEQDAFAAERAKIIGLRSDGARLTNLTKGGDGFTPSQLKEMYEDPAQRERASRQVRAQWACPEFAEKRRRSMRGVKKRNAASQYVGVGYAKSKLRWSASYRFEGSPNRKHLGYYATEQEAVEARQAFIMRLNAC
jgi:hypothetical protein